MAQTAKSGNAQRPNILLILTDDLGSEASALYPALYNANAGGFGQVATPTISALAARGLVFDNVWATPLCSPTRAALLTGRYGHNTGVTTVNNVLPGSTGSIFELLTATGPEPRYRMGVFGKWHLAGPAGSVDHVVKETGVPLFKGFLGSHITDYYNWTLDSSAAPSANTRTYATTAITDFAIEFVRAQNQSAPWFMYLPYNAPHGTDAFDGFQVPPAHLFSRDVGGRPSGPKVYDGDIPVYQALIQALDTEIGRLFRAMEETGQLNNTVIIFMGDNGTPAAVKDRASRIRGSKRDVYEGGVRVPLVVAGPGVRRGRAAHVISSPDLNATLAELAGVSTADKSRSNGFSIVPLLGKSQAATGRKYSFTELCPNNGTGRKQFAVRDQRFKVLYSGGSWEMYDLENDPWETINLYDDPRHAATRGMLLSELAALKSQAATNGCFVDIPRTPARPSAHGAELGRRTQLFNEARKRR
jgi:arylsulfatase A-like enzyme